MFKSFAVAALLAIADAAVITFEISEVQTGADASIVTLVLTDPADAANNRTVENWPAALESAVGENVDFDDQTNEYTYAGSTVTITTAESGNTSETGGNTPESSGTGGAGTGDVNTTEPDEPEYGADIAGLQNALEEAVEDFPLGTATVRTGW